VRNAAEIKACIYRSSWCNVAHAQLSHGVFLPFSAHGRAKRDFQRAKRSVKEKAAKQNARRRGANYGFFWITFFPKVFFDYF
jgi:hypothetical protein